MKVWPKNDVLRKLLKHPLAGGFRDEGEADWPDDTFTFRLVRDGDLLTEVPAASSHSKLATPKEATPKEK